MADRKRRGFGLIIALALIFSIGAAGWTIYGGAKHQGPGVVHPHARPHDPSNANAHAPVAAGHTKQILFGDLHVHTTFSTDAYLRSIPLVNGEGVHPPADACDFARFCSSLDFFALTDHAETLTPAHWRESKESIRQCNAVAGDPRDPDLVAFMGFEWSQVGATPETHYGHRNVVFRDTDEAHLPARPIAAPGLIGNTLRNRRALPVGLLLSVPLREFGSRQEYLDLARFQREVTSVPPCLEGLPVQQLPADCRETAGTPRELFEKLHQWGFPALAIPHGMTWGFYTPPGYRFDKSLAPAEQDEGMQRLVEVYSGHGNSEEFRRWHEVDTAADGSPICPAPTADYEPCCHRAGELIRGRCGAIDATECQRRVDEATRDYMAAGAAGHLTVPGATVEDWGDCGQCRDCFAPAFSYRPGGSAQYILAAENLDDPAHPTRSRFGFIASSDNHSARPGTGFKEFARRKQTETAGARDPEWRERLMGLPETKAPAARSIDPRGAADIRPMRLVDLERQASFFLTGGLVAVHAEARDRDTIWRALERREVYGTSGDRILLWFDLENAPAGPAPMGSVVKLPPSEAPRFTVTALGAFEQKPGCPDLGKNGLPPDRLARVCIGECYNPGDHRRRITRVEVVRIHPRRSAAEPIAPLIEDPWKRFECPPGPTENGCRVAFEDPEFGGAKRDTVYYVRAIQEPTPAVNGGNLRCERNDKGECVKLQPCYGDYRTPVDADCLQPIEERAWSSPIFVDLAQ